MPVLADESLIRREYLEDLAAFFGYSEAECKEKLLAYEWTDMANAWRRSNPQTPKEVRAFYSTTDLYIWELTAVHSYYAAIEPQTLVERFPPESYARVLDYGSGIGDIALHLAQAGYRVTIADVPGKTQEYAVHRFRRRGLPVRVIRIEDRVPDLDTYDLVICLEVLEHVPNPDEVLAALVASIRPGGVALLAVSFGEDERFPHHLPEGRRRYGGVRWDMLVEAHNLDWIEDKLYRKGPNARARGRWWRYRIWRLYPGRSAVLDRFWFDAAFEAHTDGDLARVRQSLWRGLLNNPARVANPGVRSILADAILGRRFAAVLKRAARLRR